MRALTDPWGVLSLQLGACVGMLALIAFLRTGDVWKWRLAADEHLLLLVTIAAIVSLHAVVLVLLFREARRDETSRR